MEPIQNNYGLPQNPSWGQFAGNALQDVQGLLQGLPSTIGTLSSLTPGSAFLQRLQNPSAMPELRQAQTLGQMGSGVLQEYKDLLSGGVKRAYEKPVTTALDVLPFIQGGKAALTGKGAEAAAVTSPLEETGNAILRSQYKLSPSQARATQLGSSVGKLADYGLTNANTIREVVPQITGDTGVLSKMVRDTIAKSPPIDVGGISDVARNLIENEPLLSESASRKFLNVINKGITSMAGETVGGGDAAKAFDFVQNLEGKAATLMRGNDEAQALSRTYRGVADELKNKIFNRPEVTVNPDTVAPYMDQINKISSRLGQEVAGAKSLQDLRSLQAPFVRMGKAIGLSDSAVDNAILSSRDLGAGIMGAVAMGGPGVIPSILAERAAETPAFKAALGGGVREAGKVIGGLTTPTAQRVAGVMGPVLSSPEGGTPQPDQQAPQQQGQPSNQIAPPIGSIAQDPQTSHYMLPENPGISPLTPGTPEYTRASNAMTGGVRQFMQNAPQYMGTVNQVVDDQKSGMPLDILRNFKDIRALQSYMSNPNNPYAKQLADVGKLNSQFRSAYQAITGTMPDDSQLLSPGNSAEQFNEKFQEMVKFIHDSYAQFQVPYFHTTETVASPNIQGVGTVPYTGMTGVTSGQMAPIPLPQSGLPSINFPTQ